GGRRILYWGCLRATGRRTQLTEATGPADDAPISNSMFRTSRRFVAYVQSRGDHYGAAALYVHAFDLPTGHRAAGVPTTGIPIGEALRRPDGTWSFGVAGLAVSDAGGVAWHEVGQPKPDEPAAEKIV